MEYECEVANVLTPEEFQSRELTATSLPAEEKSGLQERSIERHEATVHASDWPVYVELTNGRTFGCDLVVSATGVVPNTLPFANNGSGLEVIKSSFTVYVHVHGLGSYPGPAHLSVAASIVKRVLQAMESWAGPWYEAICMDSSWSLQALI